MAAAPRNEPTTRVQAASWACPELTRLAGMSRRRLLQAGGLSAVGLGLPDLWQAQAQGPSPSGGPGFARAKACIFLFMWGGPSQLDTFDPKPDAPDDIRGEFATIATKVPEIRISEHFSRLAQMTDRVAFVRSLTHTDPAHLSSAHCILTGHLAPVVNSDVAPPSERDTPHVGSVIARVRAAPAGLPPFVTMPWMASHPAAPGGQAPGQRGGWLGRSLDPLLVTGDPNQRGWRVPALDLLPDISIDRLHRRHTLLESLDSLRQAADKSAEAGGMNAHQQRAFGLLGSASVRRAFDLSREPDAVRERYGRHIHGQCVLLARRLVEHGVPLVSVNWHNDGKTFWDTHRNNFNRLKNDLIPPADQALTALLDDLQQRGMLSETLVVWVGEFGRRPNISRQDAGGRDHWPFCYSGLLAGGGIRGGTVYGTSDRQAAYPAQDPVRPQEFVATLFHALGIASTATLNDRLGRPRHVYAGDPIRPLFG